MVEVIVWTQVILIPILGALFVGIRAENDRRERLLATSLKALGIIGLLRGRNRLGNKNEN